MNPASSDYTIYRLPKDPKDYTAEDAAHAFRGDPQRVQLILARIVAICIADDDDDDTDEFLLSDRN